MGLQFGLETNSFESDATKRKTSKMCLRRFRWLFKIDDVSARGTNALPPSQSARPSISFVESEARHLNENFSFPAKPDWRPINLVLYDVVKSNTGGGRIHPVFEWLSKVYNVNTTQADWFPVTQNAFIKDCDLEMLDGCGSVLETWRFESVWPQAVDFGTLDMANQEIMTCDLTLRYARAYIIKTTS